LSVSRAQLLKLSVPFRAALIDGLDKGWGGHLRVSKMQGEFGETPALVFDLPQFVFLKCDSCDA
jgi:hypothetical protein